MSSLAVAVAYPNASMRAIVETYQRPPGWTSTATAPFKLATKWSGMSYSDHGNWVIGAPDVLLDPASTSAYQAERIGVQGLQVLLLDACYVVLDHPQKPGRVTPVGLERKVRTNSLDIMKSIPDIMKSIPVQYFSV